MSPEEKTEKLNKEPGYTLIDYFIYEKNDLFFPYDIDHKEAGKIPTKYYMVDFRTIFRVNCNKIINPKQVPLQCKCLQLTVFARNQLREKMLYYFSRNADIVEKVKT
jgi:hypothetical protein